VVPGSFQALLKVIPEPGLVLAIFLLSLRLAAMLLLTPILHAFNVPAVVRVLLIVGFAVALACGLPHQATAEMLSWDAERLIAACLTEVALGATMAVAILSAFAAISLAGRLIDIQIGFGIAQVFDPVSKRQVPVLTAAFNQFGALFFFAMNGHHALLRGVAYSLERFPLGQSWSVELAAPALMKQVAGLFTLGLAMAAPVVVALLLLELALGVVARNLPQVNMFVIGIPVKIVAGLAALSFWFAGIGDAMGRVYASIFETWGAMFAATQAAGAR
jgi:flagellar biosynthetic protein FliR